MPNFKVKRSTSEPGGAQQEALLIRSMPGLIRLFRKLLYEVGKAAFESDIEGERYVRRPITVFGQAVLGRFLRRSACSVRNVRLLYDGRSPGECGDAAGTGFLRRLAP